MRARFATLALAALAALVLAGVHGSTVPEQIHTAFAGHDVDGNCNEMAVSWATPNATATSTVMYGFTADSLTLTATGYGVTYLPVRLLLVCTLPRLSPGVW